MIRGLLLDLDDTLYGYPPCEAAGRARLAELAGQRLQIEPVAFAAAYDRARHAVKARCGGPSNHSRLLYLHELLHELGAPLHHATPLEHAFWQAYLAVAALRPGAIEMLDAFRATGGKIAIVTDLTLDVQLQKLAHFGLLDRVDALVTSEEVGFDKPHRAAFDLGAARLGLSLAECAMAGDSDAKDGAGARALGLPFFLIRTQDSPNGMTLVELSRVLAERNA